MPINDFELFENIRFFLNGNFNLDQIIYYSGYKEEVLDGFFTKYYYLFDKIIIYDI